MNASIIQTSRPSSPTTMYGSGSKVRNGASASTRSRMLRRISSRLSAVTSSLNGSLVEIAAIERDEQPAEEAAEHDAAGALVRRQVVGLALRVVELLLARLDVDVGVGQLAEIDLGPRHLDGRESCSAPACC